MTKPRAGDGKDQIEPPQPTGADEELVAADDTVIGRAFKWSLLVAGVIVVVVGLGLWWSGREVRKAAPISAVVSPPQTIKQSANPPRVTFVDVTQRAGIDFVHENGATGDKLLPESMGGGVAFLDYDGDGDQDLLFVNSTHWPGSSAKDATPATMALYRNDGKGQFENVTQASGLDVSFYGMGVAVGDYDNDGRIDVFVTAVGRNHLFRNTENGFADVTASAGVAGAESDWSTCAAMIDYDNDGDLDLFVGNYVSWSREIDFEVNYTLVGLGRAYGPPMNYEGRHPYLYRNNGDGTFADVTKDAGLQVINRATGVPVGKALGVAPIDIDRDGWIDLVVANDTVRNFFFHNNKDGTFTDEGVETALAFDVNGGATGAMGIDAAYYRNTNDLGFFIGNFANEMTSLYVSQGEPLLYADEAITEGIGSPTRLMLSFGVFLFDYDLDGRLDLLQANGHLEEEINVVQPSQHYEQPPQLFWNSGQDIRCFVPVEPNATGDLGKPIVGRGSSYADVDGDGDLDVVLTQTGRRPRLLINEQRLNHHWVRIKLEGTHSNRNAIGAVVEATIRAVADPAVVEPTGGGAAKPAIGDGTAAHTVTQRRQVMPTRSYLAQVELPITFGLGDADRIDQLTVTWPRGAIETFNNLAANHTYTIREGEGLVATDGIQPAE